MKYAISVCKNRKDISYKNIEVSWEELVTKLSKTHKTYETYKEYSNMKKGTQDEIKDVGGFVGGHLSGGRRKRDTVMNRSLLALDLDFAELDFFEGFDFLYGYKALCYSTHKHSKKTPKYRLIIPLSKPIAPDKYEPIARYIASEIGIDMFDDTTFQAERMMYFPSTSKDGEFYFKKVDGEILNPDEILDKYENWKDVSSWPTSSRVDKVIRREISKQENPLDKPGLVGAFCRTYTISEVIEKYLKDVYTEGDNGRYSYIHGSSSNGVVVYDDIFSYSHHGTDPTSLQLCNAFDLVRLHKYKDLDDNVSEKTNTTKLPSFKKMIEIIQKDKKIIGAYNKEMVENAFSDVDLSEIDVEENNFDWVENLTVDKNGKIESTVDNIKIIVANDSQTKNSIGYNEFAERIVIRRDLPWRKLEKNDKLNSFADIDMAGFRHYLEKYYKISGVQKIQDGVELCANENKFHPIKDYLNSLQWDGIPRVDSLFIDYLGADDSELIRAQTRKALTACVTRIYNKGAKFDYVLTLVGLQGVGKSTILKKLGGDYYTESINLQNINKDTVESLRGCWVVEFGELTGLKKAETEAVKNFISRTHDEYRKSYGHHSSVFPRQCVFFGTSNEDEFLKDATGNRRWWVVKTNVDNKTKDVFEDLTEYEVNQIWAEALQFHKKGEKLYLSKELELKAKEIQEQFTEKSPLQGAIEEFLELPILANWNKIDVFDRQQYYRNLKDARYENMEKVKRDKVCVQIIWVECFGRKIEELHRGNSLEISKCLSSVEGWEKTGKSFRFPIYGSYKAFERLSTLDTLLDT